MFITGITFGTFDVLHTGHIYFLTQAKLLCKDLVVGIESNDLVKESKGHEPTFDEDDRALIIQSLRPVDKTFIYYDRDYHEYAKDVGAYYGSYCIIFGDNNLNSLESHFKSKDIWEKTNIPMFTVPTRIASSTEVKNKIRCI